jgi:hypothetical protein
MTTHLLIKIHPVYFEGKTQNFFPTWVTELNRYLAGISISRNCKMITISNTPCPAYLVTGMDFPLSGRSFDEFCSLTGYDTTIKVIEGHYRWQSGYGFSISISNNGALKTDFKDLNNHIKTNWLINRCLEFLTWFNSAYDDDLVLNMSIFLTLTSISMGALTIQQVAAV